MVIKSTFYDTTPGEGVKETKWAQSATSRGPMYGVAGAGDLKLTAHPSTPYAVNLSPGIFWGQGVWDESGDIATVQCEVPAKGVVRYDLIVAHRDWQPTGGGPTSLVAIKGGTGAQIPSERQNRPGTVDDQPLWLVQWTGGQTQPTKIIDLRCWASNGGVEIANKLALDYLGEPGAAVKLGRSVWRYESKGNGVWGWGEYLPADPLSPSVRGGYGVVRTIAGGFCTIGYKDAFPTGTYSAVANAMDPPGGAVTLKFIKGEPHAASFKATGSDGKPLENVSVGISYIATGY